MNLHVVVFIATGDCLFFFFFRIVPNFNMMKTVTLLVHAAGLFWCCHNPANSDMDYGIFNMRMWPIVHAYTHGGPRFIVSSKGLFVESAQNLTPKKSQGVRKA